MSSPLAIDGLILLDTLGSCVLALDRGGICRHASAPLLRLLKLDAALERPVEEILRRGANRHLPPWEEILARLDTGAETAFHSDHETFLRGDGPPLPAEVHLHRLEGSEIRFLVHLRDLTEVTRQSKAFHASVRSFRSLLDGVTDAIFFLNSKGKALDANQGAQRMFGHTPDKFLGKGLAGLAADAGLDPLDSILQSVLGGKAQRLEYLSKGRAGARFPAEMYLYPANYFGQDAVMVIVHDISERKAHEASLLAAKAQAEEASRLKSQLMGNMSHELRTPMNGILGMGEILLETRLDEEQRDYAQTMLDSARQLLGILGDILDYSALESGKARLNDDLFCPFMLIEQMEGEFGRRCREKGLTLKLELEELPELAQGDMEALTKTLRRVLDNAVKFTEQGEVTLAAGVAETRPEGPVLRFAVRDRGIGIAPEQQGKVFDAFHQVDGAITRKYGGAGMGLATARALVNALGGSLTLESALGEGSCFTLTVPLRYAD
ncbi:MAG: PAS domain S-box protein [Betaproteobacteria bacterium]|nr:PAS domain S-box protein [Betaproteobacteria bacterium]